ncbi:MAG: hypothetical protein KME64_41550 [Scytonematopsis contorta HA4267-MV1]|jgi:hypothetical protein|nr:hypothetical protein [Scytonematopsis contorta HA4267-MV1]
MKQPNDQRGKRADPNYKQITGMVPKQLALYFKARCAELETDMSKVLEMLVRSWLLNPTKPEAPNPLAQLVLDNYPRLLEIGDIKPERLDVLVMGEKPCVGDLAKLAHNLSLEEEYLVELRNKSFPPEVEQKPTNKKQKNGTT